MKKSIKGTVKEVRRGMRTKLLSAFFCIGIVLFVSSLISILEYSKMSTYVSDLIAGNIRNINTVQSLGSASENYNLALLTVIGDDGKTVKVPETDHEAFIAKCDSLKSAIEDVKVHPLIDSVQYAYSAYMLASMELPDVLIDDFTDTRDWYFGRLQPKYSRLRADIENLSVAIFADLQKNSFTFQRGFYRSIIPGIVAVGVGILLLLLLMFFLLANYVNPIYRMLQHLEAYRSANKPYTCQFDGDSQLTDLNDSIANLIEENQSLKKRNKMLKNPGSNESDL